MKTRFTTSRLNYLHAASLLLIVVITLPVHAQSGVWRSLNAFPGRSVWSAAADSSGYVYIDAVDAGTYRSTDNGDGWIQLDAGGRLAVAPNGNVFAAIANTVSRSADHGETWKDIVIDQFHPITDILCMAAHKDGTLYLGTYRQGLLRSTDDGETWSKTGAGLEEVAIWSILFAPNDYMFAGTDSGIFRSTDKGISWSRAANPGGYQEVRALAVNSKGELLAGTLDYEIYISSDNGEHWNTTGTSPINILSLVTTRKRVFAGTAASGIFHSTDDGASWQPYNGGIADGHVSFSSLVISRRGFVFAGGADGEGVYRSAVPGQAGAVVPEHETEEKTIIQKGNILHYHVLNPAITRISIYNNLGQEVVRPLDSWRETGIYTLPLDAMHLMPGTYYCVIHSGVDITGTLRILIAPS